MLRLAMPQDNFPLGKPLTVVGGKDSLGYAHELLVDEDGALKTSSATPTGSSTAANQTTQITAEQAIQAGVGAVADAAATQGSTGSVSAKLRTVTAQLNTSNTSTASIDTKTPALVSGRSPVDGSGVTQPISAAALPLPSGAATEVTLAALLGRFTKRTYSCAFSVALAASATDVVEIIGSATTTVEITRITIGGVQTTAGQVLMYMTRRSTAAPDGTASNQTIVPHQATDAAATAVVKAYTTNPTPGTPVGNIRTRRLSIGQVASLTDPAVFTFGENGKPVILAGVAQTLCINLGGVTVVGGTLDIEVELTEF